MLSQAKGRINKHWMLLDNQSTVNVISNGDLLTNIRQIDQYMHIYCNAGKASTNWVGDLYGVGTVWFHKNVIANILSLSLVKEMHRVTFDSAADNVFKMHGISGDTYRGFGESPRGLYYSCMKESATVLTINTVEENKTKYSNLDQRRADKARKFQDIVGLPTRALVKLIDANEIPNCPVTRAYLKISDDILGPSLA